MSNCAQGTTLYFTMDHRPQREQEARQALAALSERIIEQIRQENGFRGSIAITFAVSYGPTYTNPAAHRVVGRCTPAESEHPSASFELSVSTLAKRLTDELVPFETGTYEVTISARHSSRKVDDDEDTV